MRRLISLATAAILGAAIVFALSGSCCHNKCCDELINLSKRDTTLEDTRREFVSSSDLASFKGIIAVSTDPAGSCKDFTTHYIRGKFCMSGANRWLGETPCCQQQDTQATCQAKKTDFVDRCELALLADLRRAVPQCQASPS